MAVKTDNTVVVQSSTDAEFRLWASFIHSVFVLTSCWVDTAAAGSIDFTTVLKPAALNTSQGFKVYRMNDTLQATAPVFVKIEYGSAAAAVNPAIWFTVGTTHDGSGNLGNILFVRTQIFAGGASSSASKCIGSADTNRVTFAMFLNIVNTYPFWFSIERTKDATGADTGTGLLLAFGKAFAIHTSAYLPFVTSIPPATIGLHCILTNESPSAWDGDVGVSAMIPMGTAPKQPGLNIILCRALDFADYAGPIVTIYGASHAYQHCGPNISSLKAGAGALADTNIRLCLRYE
jgi:hypothetical protein